MWQFYLLNHVYDRRQNWITCSLVTIVISVKSAYIKFVNHNVTIKTNKNKTVMPLFLTAHYTQGKKWSLGANWLMAAYLGFHSMKQQGIFLLPQDGMLVHHRSLPRNLLGLLNNYSPVPIYTSGWREALWELSVLPRTKHSVPSQGTSPDRSLRGWANYRAFHFKNYTVYQMMHTVHYPITCMAHTIYNYCMWHKSPVLVTGNIRPSDGQSDLWILLLFQLTFQCRYKNILGN